MRVPLRGTFNTNGYGYVVKDALTGKRIGRYSVAQLRRGLMVRLPKSHSAAVYIIDPYLPPGTFY